MSFYTSESDERFFSAVGRFTVSWARLDSSLDMAVSEIHKHYPNVAEKGLPVALSKKLRYLRRASRKIPAFFHLQKQIKENSEEITKASETRHNLIHGAVISHPKEDDNDKIIEFFRLYAKDNQMIAKYASFTSIEILKEAGFVIRLANKTANLALEIMDAIEKDTSKSSRPTRRPVRRFVPKWLSCAQRD